MDTIFYSSTLKHPNLMTYSTIEFVGENLKERYDPGILFITCPF